MHHGRERGARGRFFDSLCREPLALVELASEQGRLRQAALVKVLPVQASVSRRLMSGVQSRAVLVVGYILYAVLGSCRVTASVSCLSRVGPKCMECHPLT